MNKCSIAITGAAGNIAYSLIFRILSGNIFMPDTKIDLRLLDIPDTKKILHGVKLEIEDCAFTSLDTITVTDKPDVAFADCDYILLVGAKPRSKGMQRSDLILDNAHIFSDQGKIINKVSKKSAKIIVVGNPANTNALIVCSNTPDIPNENISSLMRLDQNRAKSILSSKVGQHVSSVTKLVVWGNHSTTQYPDISHAQINNSNNFLDTIDEQWIHDDFIPRVQKRGAEIIEHRGLSSAASAASAVYDHFNVLVNGSDDWESMGILTSNNYSITSNLFYSLPLKISKNSFDVIESIEVSEKMRTYLSATEKELIDERDTVKEFL